MEEHYDKENFDKWKKDGDVCEYFVLKRLQRKYPKAHNINVDGVAFSDWDLVVPEINKTFEVKGDFVSLETGNVVVEISDNVNNAELT